MRKAAFFSIGFFLGLALCLMLVYALGLVLGQFGIQLYESEADQQRNFNFFVAAGLAFGLMGGIFSLKKFSR